MEGLLIHEEVVKVAPLLPSSRLSWRFPDAYTFVLPLSKGALWLFNRPPDPRVAYRQEMPPPGGTRSSFQDLLVARAAGDLLSAEQVKLDRVLKLHFAASEGFVATPPVTLVAELTGRNCNLILLDEAGVILGAAKEVTAEVNRFRQVRPGLPYQPPPPYDKLDPREASEADLRAALTGKKLKNVRKVVDGIGPDLTAALAKLAGLAPEQVLSDEHLGQVLSILERLVREPERALEEALERPDLSTLREQEKRERLLTRVKSGLTKEKDLVAKRLTDIDKARRAAQDAVVLRNEADVLMAYSYQVPEGAERVSLTDFSGEGLELTLDPSLDAVGNAQSRYERAKKREARASQAEAREDDLLKRQRELEGLEQSLSELAEKRLEELAARYAPEKAQRRLEPGIRYTGPLGFKVIVGRNAKENDIVTFKLARSLDLWLHVQGYRGSHVIVQAEGREVPFEVIVFAAKLAAAYSKAALSDNVPVDYTLRKHVWRPKGAAPGAVYFTQQKTVYVTPSRRPGEATSGGV